jgi:DNA-binding Lrp family transcriptional regulator
MAQARDHREPGHFWADNEIIDNHLEAIGVYGFAVYMLLTRYANFKTGQCDPSVGTIAKKLGISAPTVRKAIEALIQEGLISRDERPRNEDDRKKNDTNIYTLLAVAKKGTKPALVPNDVDQGVLNDVDQGTQSDLVGVLNHVESNNTHGNKTHDKTKNRASASPAISIYTEITGRRPTQHQRKMTEQVQDLDIWRKTVELFASKGWNVGDFTNLLDRYHKEVAAAENDRKLREAQEARYQKPGIETEGKRLLTKEEIKQQMKEMGPLWRKTAAL